MKRVSKVNKAPNKRLPDCRVCGDKSSGFHYGVFVCVACKGFFKRNLKSSRVITCIQGNGRCMISGRDHRRKCNYCRLDVCKQVGMSKQAMRPGRYSKERLEALPTDDSDVLLSTDISQSRNSVISSNKISSNFVLPSKLRGLQRQNFAERDANISLTSFCDSSESKHVNRAENTIDLTLEQVILDGAIVSNNSKAVAQTFLQNSCGLNKLSSKVVCCTITKFDYMAVSNQNTFHSSKLLESPTGYSFQCAPAAIGLKEASPLNVEMEEIVNALSRKVDSFLVPETYMDDVKLLALQRKYYSGYWSRRSPNADTNDGVISSEIEVICRDVHKFIDVFVKGFIETAQLIPGFSTLPVGDKAYLFKANVLETWLCFHYPCFNEELQVVCAGIFSAHQSHMAYFLNEKVASLMWRMASRLKGIQLSKKEIPVVWAVTLLNPDRRPYENSTKIRDLRERMLHCLEYLCRRSSQCTATKFQQILEVMYELQAASTLFDEISKIHFRLPYQVNDSKGITA